MTAWQVVLVCWFALNAFLYVAMIGKTLSFTVASALLSLPVYAVLIFAAVRA